MTLNLWFFYLDFPDPGVYVVLGIKPWALYVLGKTFANWATSQPALFSEFFTMSGIFTETDRRDRIHNFRMLDQHSWSAFIHSFLVFHKHSWGCVGVCISYLATLYMYIMSFDSIHPPFPSLVPSFPMDPSSHGSQSLIIAACVSMGRTH